MKYTLIGSETCPFVQRCLLTLLIKKADFEMRFIDLAQKPAWFKELSPTGKVPLLQIGKNVLFESTVINEFIDETINPKLHPDDPMQRALNRGWIEFSSSLQATHYALLTASEESQIALLLQQLDQKLLVIETTKKQLPYFNGSNFSLVDIAFAPFFIRLQLIEEYYPLNLLANKPATDQWSKNVLNHPVVKKSASTDYKFLILQNIKTKKALSLTFCPLHLKNEINADAN